MKKILIFMLFAISMVVLSTGCTKKGDDTITMVWYPNESGEDVKGARDEIGRIIEEATGMEVKHQLTTDYVIAIESIASGNAQVGFFGAKGYIMANEKNSKVQPLVVNSGSSGTLEDAIYYSWLGVKLENKDSYMLNGDYSIENIEGKRFSFVSNNSTSGFVVPSSDIVTYFSKNDKWKDLNEEALMEGGADKFFSEVLYGGSHQGALVNLLSDRADIASFCDTCVANYVELVSGEQNVKGSTYKVRKDAAEPLNVHVGEEFIIINSTPVLNAPFVVNTEKLDKETVEKLVAAFTSDTTTNNEKVFVPKESEFKGLFKQGSKFVEVKDEWFNPIRELSK